MKYSIRKQFAVVFIAVMSGAILLCWFINSTLLEKYYIQNKQKVLLMAYDKISTASKEGTINSDEFDIELDRKSVV